MARRNTDPIWKKRLRQKPRSARSAVVLKLLKGFEQSQWWDPERIRAKQFKQMSELPAHAQQTVSHYGRTLGRVDPHNIKSMMAGSWHDLPILQRDTVNRLGDGQLSRDIEGKLAVIRSSEKGFASYPQGAHQNSWGDDLVFKTGHGMSLNFNTSIPDMRNGSPGTSPTTSSPYPMSSNALLPTAWIVALRCQALRRCRPMASGAPS